MKNTILMDFFNTIVYRKDSPKNILYKWLIKLGYKYSIEPGILYKWYKKETHKIVVRNKIKFGESEYKFEDVIKKLKEHFMYYNVILDDNFESIALNLYVETEKEHLFLNTKAYQIIIDNYNKGNNIYIVSDFYCSKNIMQSFVEFLGIDKYISNIFVSCDYLKSKRTGRLYKKVLKEIYAKNKNCIMYGDNINSDVFRARMKGLKSVWLKTTQNTKNKVNLLKNYKKGCNYSKILEVYNKNDDNMVLSNYAFPLYIFVKRLAETLKTNYIDTIFFCSREGQFLKKIFDYYCLYHNINIKSHYFLISRNSILSASLRPITEENFNFIIDETLTMNVYRFLKTLNFTKEEIEIISKDANIKLYKNSRNFKKCSEYLKLLKNYIFLDLYNKKRNEQREGFKKYLETFDYDYNKKGFYFVDIGWKGTMQNWLNIYFKNKVKTVGFYLGCRKAITSYNVIKKGILYQKQRPHKYGNNLFNFKLYTYEQICRANHNRVSGYYIKDGQSVVSYSNEHNELQTYINLIEPLQKNIFEKFKLITSYDFKYCSLAEEICLKMFAKLIKDFSKEDQKWLFMAEDSHYDNYARIGYDIKRYKRWMRGVYTQSARLWFGIKWVFTPNKKILYK